MGERLLSQETGSKMARCSGCKKLSGAHLFLANTFSSSWIWAEVKCVLWRLWRRLFFSPPSLEASSLQRPSSSVLLAPSFLFSVSRLLMPLLASLMMSFVCLSIWSKYKKI